MLAAPEQRPAVERDVEGIDRGEARRQRGFPTEELVVDDMDLVRGGGRTAHQKEKSERKSEVHKNDCNSLISKVQIAGLQLAK